MPDRIQSNTCPRCGSFVIVETDSYGTFATCVVCGHVHDDGAGDPMALAEELRPVVGEKRQREPSHSFKSL